MTIFDKRTSAFLLLASMLAFMGSDAASHSASHYPLAPFHVAQCDRDTVGYAASLLVLTTFAMQSMRPLRITAIASNVAFIAYASIAHLHPILLLHSILLPLNAYRLVQLERSKKEV